MRGKENSGGCKRCCIRITPAYAGKSLPKSWRNMTQKGSPPPMRGKEYRRYLRRNERGITPAYAGKSYAAEAANYRPVGSPPPMRGKGLNAPWSGFHFRITPAYAGKRSQTRCLTISRWDHPRLCGEKRQSLIWRLLETGSPPPMRGKGQRHF